MCLIGWPFVFRSFEITLHEGTGNMESCGVQAFEVSSL